MTDLLSPANFEFFARNLLAGYVLMFARAAFVSGERPKAAESLVEAVIFSLINQMAFLVIGGLAIWANAAPTLPPRVTLVLEILVLPAMLGALLGALVRHGRGRAVLRRLSLPISHPVRSAYVYALASQDKPTFVLLTFEDGTRVYGYFGQKSLAGQTWQEGDLYLESIYTAAEDGTLAEADPPRSALISLNGLRSIEFIPE